MIYNGTLEYLFKTIVDNRKLIYNIWCEKTTTTHVSYLWDVLYNMFGVNCIVNKAMFTKEIMNITVGNNLYVENIVWMSMVLDTKYLQDVHPIITIQDKYNTCLLMFYTNADAYEMKRKIEGRDYE